MSMALPATCSSRDHSLAAWLIWTASRRLLAAAREGRRDTAENFGRALVNTREHPACTPSMRRVIDSALTIALARFGGAGPGFTPAQSDEGDVA